jgi:hypothetical protein
VSRTSAAVRYIPDYKIGSPEVMTEHLFVAVLEAVTFLAPGAAPGQPAGSVEQRVAAILRA